MKLWQKDYTPNEKIEAFVVDKDYLLDQALVRFDCLGSIAHIKGLLDIGILTADEFSLLKNGLLEIIELDKKGRFIIQFSDEDVHTKIENHLTEKLGDVAKKIHTARSRNDQILTAIRLYAKERFLTIEEKTASLSLSFLAFAEKYSMIPMPGRTHLQKAMPSSLGLWAGAFSESVLDNFIIMEASYELLDQSPLGSGAGYGIPLPLNRELTAELLSFSKVQRNSLYANNSRGKFEANLLMSLLGVVLDISKFSADLILFLLPEFSYFHLQDEFFLGSSIMPQKKNPSFLEMIRARSNTFISLVFQAISITNNLPSGYNQDFQETKEPFIKGLDLGEELIEIARLIIENLKPNEEALKSACSPEIFAQDKAIELVKEGMPFREAYQKVAQELDKIEIPEIEEALKKRSHIGGSGNLQLTRLREEI
ncbi:argininosuccinate lyase, partial [bacterium]|nr:argininosuccinate lyase [bacterium]